MLTTILILVGTFLLIGFFGILIGRFLAYVDKRDREAHKDILPR